MVRRSCLLLLAACCRSAGQAGRSDENVCDGSSQRTATEVLSFFADALGGSKTRGESLEEADTLTRDLEHRCTPKLARNPLVWEAATGLSWQILRDGERTLRLLELRVAATGSLLPSTGEQLALLRERVASLRLYTERVQSARESAESDETSGYGYPSAGCGRFATPTAGRRESGAAGAEGGWLSEPSSTSRARWGGDGACTIRVLTAADWHAASAQCLAALFRRPFVVRSGGEAIINRSNFQREAMLATAAQSTLAVGSLGDSSDTTTRVATFAAYTATMRQETEEGEARSYVFESELLEQHHLTFLRGTDLPRQLDGHFNMHAPLLVNLAVGAPGGGVYFHRHDAAFSVLSFGEKRWFFYPELPTEANRSRYERAVATFLAPAAGNSKALAEDGRVEALMREQDGGGSSIETCTQQPGDLIFTPHMWCDTCIPIPHLQQLILAP
jgi:hypothetical protein